MTGRPDLQAALATLPRDHVLVLRGALSGFDVVDLAALVTVPVEGVVPLLQVAVAKLDRALGDLAHPPKGRPAPGDRDAGPS